MKKTLPLLLAACLIVSPAFAVKKTKYAAKAPAKTSAEILAAAPESDWRNLDPNNTVVMTLAQGPVIIELAPRFAPEHAANILALARGGFFDGLSIVRVQDNFVTQWGDPNSDDPKLAKPLSEGAKPHLPAEFSVPLKSVHLRKLPDVDGWAPETGFVDGMPVAANPKTGQAWLAHCYGMVGAGRGNEKDSSTGAELYAVIGHAPRALDLNITVVGRVLQGIEFLSALPRGGQNMGFYDRPEQRTGIQSVKLVADIPEAERPKLQVLRTDGKSWPALLEARRNRTGWYVYKANHVDICSVSVPTRPAPAAAPQ